MTKTLEQLKEERQDLWDEMKNGQHVDFLDEGGAEEGYAWGVQFKLEARLEYIDKAIKEITQKKHFKL